MNFSFFGYKYNAKDQKIINNPFRLLERKKGRIIKWGGVLSQTPLCTHFVYCTRLSNYRSKLTPPKRFPEATHELRIGYRLDLGNKPLSVLYVAQYDFTSQKDLDWVADKITLSIAIKLRDIKTDRRLLLRSDPDYWDWFVDHEFRCLTKPTSND